MKYSALFSVFSLSVALFMWSCSDESASSALGKSPERPLPIARSDGRGVIPPYHEASLDPSLNQYLTKLITAVEQKDVTYLESVIDDSTRFSNGEEQGKAEFMKFWKLDNSPDKSPIWDVLNDVLSLGGGFYSQDRDIYVAPYYFIIWQQDFPPAVHSIVVGNQVGLFETPSPDANVLDTLNYNIVRDAVEKKGNVSIDGKSYPWHKVETIDGVSGWVCDKYLRSPAGYRVGFKKENGNWRVTFLVSDIAQ